MEERASRDARSCFPGNELALIRLCLRARWDAGALEEARALLAHGEFEEGRLLQLACAEGVASLLYDVMRGQNLLPAPLEDELRLVYFAAARRGYPLFNELERLLASMAAHDLPVILLKGAALALAVYRNVSVRPMSDLDLLLRREDVPRALDLLRERGYVEEQMEAHEGDTLAYENEIMLHKRGDSGHVVEVHWGLFDSPYYQHTLSGEWFWETALPLRVGNAPALMLGPEAQLLHLCGHLLLHHGGAALRLLWLHDVAEVLVLYRDALDWDELFRRAEAHALLLPLQRVLPRVIEEWQVPVPPQVVPRLCALRPSKEEERVFGWLSAAGQPVGRRFWFDLLSMPSWGQRFRYAWTGLFPSASYMQQRYRLRHPLLVPFAYLYRWFLGLRGLLSRRYR